MKVYEMIRKLLERASDKETDRILKLLLNYNINSIARLKKEDGEEIPPEDILTACIDGCQVYITKEDIA